MTEAKPNPCVACPGHCCSRNLINVCGYDAWVIARELGVSPTDFLAFAQVEKQKTPNSIRLPASEKSYCLVLNMSQQPDGSHRCMFALNLPHDQLRCGIYAFRPIICRAYPFTLEGGQVAVKPSAFCPEEGTWNLYDLDLPSLQQQLVRFEMEFCIYGLIVDGWNEHVAQQPAHEELDFRPFVNIVMDVYDQLEVVRAGVPSDAWPEIWNRCREFISDGINPLESEEMKSRQPHAWERWLQDIHQVVEDAVGKRFASARMAEVCCG